MIVPGAGIAPFFPQLPARARRPQRSSAELEVKCLPLDLQKGNSLKSAHYVGPRF
jgi:hypothetical protein